jgi:hypothetical protein
MQRLLYIHTQLQYVQDPPLPLPTDVKLKVQRLKSSCFSNLKNSGAVLCDVHIPRHRASANIDILGGGGGGYV